MFEILNESVAQKEKFRIAANKLLNQCFLLKKREDTKKEYFFVKQNMDMFVPYFDLLGYEIKLNEDQGVIGIVNQFGTGRVELSKFQSICLLILRLLYVEKRKELATFSEEVTVLMEEIREKYELLKIKSRPKMNKDMEKDLVRTFRKYNLIQNLDSDINQADARIIIYPSILLAVTVENINSLYDMTEQTLKEYALTRDQGDDIGEEA